MSDTRRVPVTEEMIEAGRKAFAEALKIDAPEGWCLTHIYEAMAAVSANNSANLRDTEASPAISRDDAFTAAMNWLDNNTTFCEDGKPVLAVVAKRIWYHATDDIESYPFSQLVRRFAHIPPDAPAISRDDELARLEITDRQCASMLLELLTLNPWPSSDPRWQLVESWAAELLKRTNNLVRIKERGDE